MRYKNLDLNLLVAFDALMEARSVTQAARKLRLSQPALSAALERLRMHFDDQLLVPEGKRMQPTATADSIHSAVRQILSDVDAMVMSSKGFEPATSKRVFRIAASDFITSVLLAPLSAVLQREAPHVGLEVLLPTLEHRDELERGEADLMMVPYDQLLRGFPAEQLLHERVVVVGWSGNPILKSRVTERQFLASGHVGVFVAGMRGDSFAERQLAIAGKQCRYEVRVPAFTLVPAALVNSTRLAVMYSRLAEQMATKYPLRISPVPFALPQLRMMMQYHASRTSDAGLAWLKSRILRAAAESSGD